MQAKNAYSHIHSVYVQQVQMRVNSLHLQQQQLYATLVKCNAATAKRNEENWQQQNASNVPGGTAFILYSDVLQQTVIDTTAA